MEIPLIIQDGAMLNPSKGMRLDEDTAFQYIKQITKAVENVGGVLTLLWHPNHIIKPDWWRFYLRALKYLKEKNAWFGFVRDVGGKLFSRYLTQMRANRFKYKKTQILFLVFHKKSQ